MLKRMRVKLYKKWPHQKESYQFIMKSLFILSICICVCLGKSFPSPMQKWPLGPARTLPLTINPDGSYTFVIRDPGKEYRAEIGFFKPGETSLTVQGFFIIRLSDGTWQTQVYQADKNGTTILLCKFWHVLWKHIFQWNLIFSWSYTNIPYYPSKYHPVDYQIVAIHSTICCKILLLDDFTRDFSIWHLPDIWQYCKQ